VKRPTARRTRGVARPAEHAARAAQLELKGIECSRAWRAVERVRRSLPYSLYARARFGRQWRRAADASRTLPPRERLAQVKGSGAYRLIASVKSSALYRALRPRRA
jgi:hypothetical protein